VQRLALAALLLLPAPPGRSDEASCGTHPDIERWLEALHTQHAATDTSAALAADDRQGQIVVLHDRGDLLLRRNLLDLDGRALRLVPNRGGYDVVPLEARSLAPAGDPLLVGSDTERAVSLPFAFPFFGRERRELVVHADGYLSFGEAPPPGRDWSLPRFLSGPPAIGAFFTDLSLDRGGSVSFRASAGQAVVTWTDLPGGAQVNRNTFQAVLSPDGTIELAYGRLETREGVVGVTPGGTVDVVRRDLSAGVLGGTGAVAEAFSESERLDLLSVVRRFLRSYPDLFEQLVVYTTRPMNPLGGSFAFEVNVKSDVQGIGLVPVDVSADWGSAGTLESVVYMDSLESYREVDGFEILGHEVSHRWLARARFRDAQGALSAKLLSGDLLHWSFFLDSGASLIGGNEMMETGDGQFETVDFARRYGPLDQYLMGLRDASEVPPFYIVEAADRFRPNRGYKSSSSPEAGVRFSGRRTTVRIEDVVAALGERVPDVRRAPHLLRQAYLIVADDETPATPDRVGVVERIRGHFAPFYQDATSGRGRVQTELP
jgi:hypothetical protein